MQSALEKAIALSNDPAALRKRLQSAKRNLLDKENAAKFARAKFDFDRKALIGDGVELVWALRRKPEEAESYSNQQTSLGYVSARRID
jgi:hypothetical protein